MKKQQNAQIYAEALFELATEKEMVETLLAEFYLLSTLQQESAEFKKILETPVLDNESKCRFLDKVLQPQVSFLFLNLLKILLHKCHFDLWPTVFTTYRKLADQKAGRRRAKITTAFALPQQQMEECTSLLRNVLKCQVVATNDVDPKIIGGLVIQADDLWIDASLRGKLEYLRRQLRKKQAVSPA